MIFRLRSLSVEPFACGSYALVSDIVVVIHQFVDNAVRRQFDYAVCDCLDEFVVVACEENVAAEVLKGVVEGLN